MIQTNASLLVVRGAGGAGGTGESYDGPQVPDAGPLKWEPAVGDPGAGVYLRERRDRVETTAGVDRTIDRILLVDHDVDVDWRSGDVVTFRRTAGDVDETATVKLVQRPEIDDPDIDRDVQTVRLTLESA